MTAWPDRPGTRVLARSLAGLAPLVMAGGLVLLAFNAPVMSPTRIGVYVFAVVAVVVYAGIGGLIAARIPQGMAGRLAALGGTLRVTSAPGHGTQVTGRVPVAQDLPSRELVA